jgi:diguanylate cyclase (GGDEF)-like protein
MADMPGDGSSDLAAAGRRLRIKVLAALALAAGVPVLALAAVVAGLAPPGSLLGVVLVTLVAVLVGASIIWSVGGTIARMARMLASEPPLHDPDRRTGEVGTLVSFFGRMLGSLDQKAAENSSLKARLEAAYRELEATKAELKETSFKDEVTGLYNRRFFSLRLEEELSRYRRFNHPVSVVLLDLDGFKSVNDSLGHAVGDDTLRDVAQILMKHSRGINVVSRYGGDEFAVLLVETSKAGARLYADRIREVVAKYPFAHGKILTASFGVASLPDDEADTAEGLFRSADEALYAAKRAGKNQVAAAAGSPAKVL